MSIAYRIQDCIADRKLTWDPVPHRASACCMESARLAHVAPDRVAKAVALESRHGPVVAVIPGNRRLDLDELGDALGEEFRLASERRLAELFADCSPGAVPPLGYAYGLETLWDEHLGDRPDVYFEAGDHRTLVHMNGSDFAALMRPARPLP